jgi:hypothetical protein
MCGNSRASTLISLRINEGEQYLLALEKLENTRWVDGYASYKKGELSLAEKFALIHPRYYEEDENLCGMSVRGSMTFDLDVSRHQLSCDAVKVWMQPCRLSRNEAVHGDHFFPRSLGGPTVAENRISLCSLHNKLKTNDVHLYSWELGEPSWLPDVIERIRRVFVATKDRLGT